MFNVQFTIFKDPWARMDSNHRTRKRADLQSAAVGHLATCPLEAISNKLLAVSGATCRNRTNDLLITNQLLYRLS
jgi:hypothetical protein